MCSRKIGLTLASVCLCIVPVAYKTAPAPQAASAQTGAIAGAQLSEAELQATFMSRTGLPLLPPARENPRLRRLHTAPLSSWISASCIA